MNEYMIYYAEDDADDLYLFEQAFAHLPDVSIKHFANGAQLLESLHSIGPEQQPCLVVLDLNMPVLDGRETLMKLRTTPQLTQLPVLLFTTSNSIIDQRFAQHWGVDLITKPVLFEDMESLASGMLARCQKKVS